MFLTNKTQRASMALAEGQRARALLLADRSTYSVDVTLEGQVDITGAVTAILNRGSLFAALTAIGLEEEGGERWNVDARALRHYAEASAPSKLSATRLTNTAVGTYVLKEHMRIHFAHPLSVDPRETSYREHNPGLRLEVFFDLAAGAISRLVKGGAAQLSNVKVTVAEVSERLTDAGELPFFIPVVRMISMPVAQAQTDLTVEIKTTNRIRAMVVSQDTAEGEVNDIIKSAILRGDNTFILGPEAQRWDDLARAQEYEFGGDVYETAKGSHVCFNFQTHGKLGKVLYPAVQDRNMRFVFDAAPSAGKAGSTIRVMLVELEHDNYQGPDGRRVTRADLPFAA